MDNADIIIIGAGVMGMSIAYNLAAKKKNISIMVVEKEKLPGTGSTARCTGGIRYQFTSKINICLTKLSMPFFQRFKSLTGVPIFLRQRGYLLCTGREERLPEFSSMLKLLHDYHIPTSFFQPQQITRLYPYINAADLKGATYCPLDAYGDPGNVVQGYYRQAVEMGVRIRFNETVQKFLLEGDRVQGIKTSRGELKAPVIVNAAGPEFSRLASLAGLQVPSRPFRRQVYVCAPLQGIPRESPLVVDMDTGFYMHVEKNGTLLLGGTDRDTAPGTDTAVDWSCLDGFIEAAVHRIPALENGKLIRAYAGTRSITPDYHGILGESKNRPGLFLAGGFGGQGFMHAPALGMIAADLIIDGKTGYMDVSRLSPDRFTGRTGPLEGAVF